MNAREDAEWVGDTITQLKAEIDQLRERCLGYKGQVEAGSIAIQHLQGEIARLRAALKPFAYYYDLNDCQEREKIPANALEVPIADLKAAKMAMTSGYPTDGLVKP